MNGEGCERHWILCSRILKIQCKQVQNTIKHGKAWDILLILLTIVVFEYVFSIGKSLISEHWSALKSETIDALICSQDWLHPMCFEANEFKDLEK